MAHAGHSYRQNPFHAYRCRGSYFLILATLLLAACGLHPVLQQEEYQARRAARANLLSDSLQLPLPTSVHASLSDSLEARFDRERELLDQEWKVVAGGRRIVYRATQDTFSRAEFAALYEEHLTVEGGKYLQAVRARYDRDGDGTLDDADACPDQPGPLRGCPDADGDGVADPDDLDLSTPPGVAVDERGRPLDSDGDGVPDYRDREPKTAPADGETIDENGVIIRDRDGDGVRDEFDECPNQPGEKEYNGCPIQSAPNVGYLGNVVSVGGTYEFGYTDDVDLYEAIESYTQAGNDAEALAFAEQLSEEYLRAFPDGAHADRVVQLRQAARRQRADLPQTPTRRPASVGATIPWQPALDTLRYECMQDKYDQGLLAFDTIPSLMQIDVPYTVVIKIDHSQNREAVTRDIEKRTQIPIDIDTIDFERQQIIGSVQLEPIEVGRFMLAEIKVAGDQSAFEIQDRYGVGFQEIDCFKPAIWEFTLIPRREGKHQLNFNIYISNDGIERRPYDEAGLTKIIEVRVVKTFWQQNLGWLAGLGIAGLGLLAFLLLRRRRQAVQQQYAAFSEDDFRDYEQRLGNNEIEQVLTAIIAKLPQGNPLRQEAQLCLTNYKQVRKDYSLNIISYEDYSQKSATAALASISLVNELQAKAREEHSPPPPTA